jgi:nucleoid-associated protein YgaU
MNESVNRKSLAIFATKYLFGALFIAALLAGCGTDDEKIHAEVQTKIAAVAPGATATVKDGVVTLTGQVDSSAVKALAKQAAREVKGVKNVVDDLSVKLTPATAVPEKAPAPLPGADDVKPKHRVTEAYYTVKNGDSLAKIAKNYPGLTWQKIYEANKDQLKNPESIHPGQKLMIPK